jgi:hypothetical protein
MPPRRKIHLPLTEAYEDDLGFECTGTPIFFGTANEDLVCGRCHRTLFLGFTRDDLFAAIAKMRSPNAPRTAVSDRRPPLIAICDCGAINRVWPIIPD